MPFLFGYQYGIRGHFLTQLNCLESPCLRQTMLEAHGLAEVTVKVLNYAKTTTRMYPNKCIQTAITALGRL